MSLSSLFPESHFHSAHLLLCCCPSSVPQHLSTCSTTKSVVLCFTLCTFPFQWAYKISDRSSQAEVLLYQNSSGKCVNLINIVYFKLINELSEFCITAGNTTLYCVTCHVRKFAAGLLRPPPLSGYVYLCGAAVSCEAGCAIPYQGLAGVRPAYFLVLAGDLIGVASGNLLQPSSTFQTITLFK